MVSLVFGFAINMRIGSSLSIEMACTLREPVIQANRRGAPAYCEGYSMHTPAREESEVCKGDPSSTTSATRALHHPTDCAVIVVGGGTTGDRKVG